MEEIPMGHVLRKWIALLVLTALLAAVPTVACAAIKPGVYGGGNVYLELDGMPMGPLTSFEGGLPYAELVPMPTNPNFDQPKRIGPVKYADITLTFGSGMARPLYQWLQDTLAKKTSVKSGAIIFVDQNYTEIKRLVFVNALIKEIGLPALSAIDGKTLFLFTLKLSPELTRPEPGRGGKVAAVTGMQKHLSVAAFRLTMPGIDSQWVSRVELPSLKAKIVTDYIGQQRMPKSSIAVTELSDVVIEMPDSHAQGLGEWVNDFLIKGNSGPAKERAATIEVLDQTMKTTLMTINLSNLGILKLEASKFSHGNDQMRTIRASMYCGGVQFNFTGK
jgi:hypothetical protein